MLQAIGGVVVFFSAYVAWRRLRLNHDELQATRDGQVTERFTRAVDQLGDGALDVRMGGIYVVSRIGETSARDWQPIIAMMAALVRTHSPWPPTTGATDVSTEAINQLPPLESRAPDVQAALTALGVLGQGRAPIWLNAGSTDLRKADGDGLHLQGLILDRCCAVAATFFEVDMTNSSLMHADFRHADVSKTRLRQARLDYADLRGARLYRTCLEDALCTGTDFREANLRHADATGASLTRADLRETDLRGADFTAAHLRECTFTGALADHNTRWPAGFDPHDAGIVLTDQPGPEPHHFPGWTLRTNLTPLKTKD